MNIRIAENNLSQAAMFGSAILYPPCYNFLEPDPQAEMPVLRQLGHFCPGLESFDRMLIGTAKSTLQAPLPSAALGPTILHSVKVLVRFASRSARVLIIIQSSFSMVWALDIAARPDCPTVLSKQLLASYRQATNGAPELLWEKRRTGFASGLPLNERMCLAIELLESTTHGELSHAFGLLFVAEADDLASRAMVRQVLVTDSPFLGSPNFHATNPRTPSRTTNDPDRNVARLTQIYIKSCRTLLAVLDDLKTPKRERVELFLRDGGFPMPISAFSLQQVTNRIDKLKQQVEKNTESNK